MGERLTFNEWVIWVRIQNDHTMNSIITYCQALDVCFMKMLRLKRQADLATAKASNKKVER